MRLQIQIWFALTLNRANRPVRHSSRIFRAGVLAVAMGFSAYLFMLLLGGGFAAWKEAVGVLTGTVCAVLGCRSGRPPHGPCDSPPVASQERDGSRCISKFVQKASGI